MKKILFFLLIIPALAYSQDLSHLKLSGVNGKKFVLKKNLKKDGTIVTFWATWCMPCQKELPTLQKLKDKYNNKDFQIIAISQDSPRSLARVKSFVRSHKYDFIFLLDPNSEISSRLMVNSIPFTMLLDAKGKAIYTHQGYKLGDEKELEEKLVEFWKKAAVKN
ncbi:MAG: TlpA family protein disulfide reductase [Calditrichaeota bacterium]|nr:TlpA family protein disulfide reductase [Calditrichota bacterium]